MELNEQKSLQLEDVSTQNSILQGKIQQLESTLGSREQELVSLDTKYRKCLEKAKEVIKNMDPRVSSLIDANILEKAQDALEDEPKPKMSQMEEHLMTTAFYRLGINAQRDAIDSKLAMLMGQGQTFLARQRQSAPRKPLNTTFKGK